MGWVEGMQGRAVGRRGWGRQVARSLELLCDWVDLEVGEWNGRRRLVLQLSGGEAWGRAVGGGRGGRGGGGHTGARGWAWGVAWRDGLIVAGIAQLQGIGERGCVFVFVLNKN